MAEKKENELQAGKLVVHFLRKYAFFVNRGRDLSALVEMTRERCGRDDTRRSNVIMATGRCDSYS